MSSDVHAFKLQRTFLLIQSTFVCAYLTQSPALSKEWNFLLSADDPQVTFSIDNVPISYAEGEVKNPEITKTTANSVSKLTDTLKRLDKIPILYFSKRSMNLVNPIIEKIPTLSKEEHADGYIIKMDPLAESELAPTIRIKLSLALGVLAYKQGHLHEAMKLFEATLKSSHENSEIDPILKATALENLAIINCRLGKHERSKDLFLEAHEIIQNSRGNDHPHVAHLKKMINELSERRSSTNDTNSTTKTTTTGLPLNEVSSADLFHELSTEAKTALAAGEALAAQMKKHVLQELPNKLGQQEADRIEREEQENKEYQRQKKERELNAAKLLALLRMLSEYEQKTSTAEKAFWEEKRKDIALQREERKRQREEEADRNKRALDEQRREHEDQLSRQAEREELTRMQERNKQLNNTSYWTRYNRR